MKQPKQVTINLDINKLGIAKCQCGNTLFDTLTVYRFMSAIVSPNGQEQLLSIPHAKCVVCASVYTMEEIVAMAKKQDTMLVMNEAEA